MSFNCFVGCNNTKEDATNKKPRKMDAIGDSKWENLPSELLHDIIRRVEGEEAAWPARRDVVVCAVVCRLWRDTTKQLVKTPQQCGLLTFPLSLKQPGPKDKPIQCFIRRNKATSTYRLYLGSSQVLAGDASKLLLAAKKVRKATRTEFLISLTVDGCSQTSNTYVGKLSSNFLGNKFVVYDAQPCYNPTFKSMPKFSLKKAYRGVSPMVKSKVGNVSYEFNVLRTEGPRRMHCTINSIPVLNEKKHEAEVEPMAMKNKEPKWHEHLQCWCLDFQGRVTVASVKNFQLAIVPSHNGHDDVILQFGKIGKDTFTMDYRYPLSAFQAFAICLSSFDPKPACE